MEWLERYAKRPKVLPELYPPRTKREVQRATKAVERMGGKSAAWALKVGLPRPDVFGEAKLPDVPFKLRPRVGHVLRHGVGVRTPGLRHLQWTEEYLPPLKLKGLKRGVFLKLRRLVTEGQAKAKAGSLAQRVLARLAFGFRRPLPEDIPLMKSIRRQMEKRAGYSLQRYARRRALVKVVAALKRQGVRRIKIAKGKRRAGGFIPIIDKIVITDPGTMDPESIIAMRPVVGHELTHRWLKRIGDPRWAIDPYLEPPEEIKEEVAKVAKWGWPKVNRLKEGRFKRFLASALHRLYPSKADIAFHKSVRRQMQRRAFKKPYSMLDAYNELMQYKYGRPLPKDFYKQKRYVRTLDKELRQHKVPRQQRLQWLSRVYGGKGGLISEEIELALKGRYPAKQVFIMPYVKKAPREMNVLLQKAYKRRREQGLNRTAAASQAWREVKKAGWKRDASGRWTHPRKPAVTPSDIYPFISNAPSEVNRIVEHVYRDMRRRGHSKVVAGMQAWRSVRAHGYRKINNEWKKRAKPVETITKRGYPLYPLAYSDAGWLEHYATIVSKRKQKDSKLRRFGRGYLGMAVGTGMVTVPAMAASAISAGSLKNVIASVRGGGPVYQPLTHRISLGGFRFKSKARRRAFLAHELGHKKVFSKLAKTARGRLAWELASSKGPKVLGNIAMLGMLFHPRLREHAWKAPLIGHVPALAHEAAATAIAIKRVGPRALGTLAPAFITHAAEPAALAAGAKLAAKWSRKKKARGKDK